MAQFMWRRVGLICYVASVPLFNQVRARDAIRAQRQQRVSTMSAPHQQRESAVPVPATVWVHPGTYHLGDLGQLQLSAEDSDTAWVAVAASTGMPTTAEFAGTSELSQLDWKVHSGKGP